MGCAVFITRDDPLSTVLLGGQASDLKDIKRGNQVKSSKRQDMEETSFHEGPDENSSGISQNGHKRPRIDYSVFHSDVARLQQNLVENQSLLDQSLDQSITQNVPSGTNVSMS